jgi:hypothetical protein
MLTFEINIVCDGQTLNGRCNEMICTEPCESGDARRALAFAAEQGWHVVATKQGVNIYCPECRIANEGTELSAVPPETAQQDGLNI